VQKRNRRPPADVLADLQRQREHLAKRLGERLAKLDARIAKVEARYDRQIKLAELTEGLSADEISQKLEEARNMQRLLRMAMKTKA
jgi:ribosome-binding protein aMBF1 (putative translation factor)